MLEHVSIPFNVLLEVTARIVCIICIAQSTFNALLVDLIRICSADFQVFWNFQFGV